MESHAERCRAQQRGGKMRQIREAGDHSARVLATIVISIHNLMYFILCPQYYIEASVFYIFHFLRVCTIIPQLNGRTSDSVNNCMHAAVYAGLLCLQGTRCAACVFYKSCAASSPAVTNGLVLVVIVVSALSPPPGRFCF